MYLAQNLRCLREQCGINQNDLADVFGITQSAVGNWEAKKRVPDIEMIIRLAKYFNVSLDDLVLKDLRAPKPTYAKNLKLLRERHGMSQEETAKLLGLKDKSNCCLVENGKQKLSVEQLMKISEYFGFTLDQFVKQDLSKKMDAYDKGSEGKKN